MASDIWNLNTLCRCCHSDGDFKSLRTAYNFKNNIEVYSTMLMETFGLNLKPPPLNASDMICDDCVYQVRSATRFKVQVLECEVKFQEYCKNELPVKAEKIEESSDNDNDGYNDIYTPNNEEIDSKETKDEIFTSIDNTENIKIEDNDNDGYNDIYTPNNEEIDSKETKDEIFTSIDNTENIKIEEKKQEVKIEKPTKKVVKKGKKVVKAKTKICHQKLSSTKGTVKYSAFLIRQKINNKTIYTCKKCNTELTSYQKFVTHVKSSHPQDADSKIRNRCLDCDEVFHTYEQLRIHTSTHTGVKQKCTLCVKSFFTEKGLAEHMKSHDKIYTCDYCQKVFYYRGTIRNHILAVHLGLRRKYPCDICGRACNDNVQLQIHKDIVHRKLRPYACDVCGDTFTANKYLKIHYRSHTGNKPYQCDECHEKFVSYSLLRYHKARHTIVKGEGKTYQCQFCPATQQTLRAYQTHKKRHHASSNFYCDQCGKQFVTKYTLNSHIKFVHLGIKSYHCSTCNIKFAQKAVLQRHIKNKHDPNNPDKLKVPVPKVSCTMCKMKVTNLDKHLQTHYKKPYSCEYCNKRFPEKSSLNRHIKCVHMLLRTFRCQFCDKAYGKTTHLKRHISKKHPEIKIEVEAEVQDPEPYVEHNNGALFIKT